MFNMDNKICICGQVLCNPDMHIHLLNGGFDFESYIKRKIAVKIAEELLIKNLIEFESDISEDGYIRYNGFINICKKSEE